MPTPTYDLIEEKVLGSAQASVTFSSIPGTYKDLVLEIRGSATSGNMELNVGNGTLSTTGQLYSYTVLYGTGTSALSNRQSSLNSMNLNYEITSNNGMTIVTANLMSYANTNVNKTVVLRSSNAAQAAETIVGLWRSTSAINILRVQGGGDLVSGSVFRLWGVSG